MPIVALGRAGHHPAIRQRGHELSHVGVYFFSALSRFSRAISSLFTV